MISAIVGVIGAINVEILVFENALVISFSDIMFEGIRVSEVEGWYIKQKAKSIKLVFLRVSFRGNRRRMTYAVMLNFECLMFNGRSEKGKGKSEMRALSIRLHYVSPGQGKHPASPAAAGYAGTRKRKNEIGTLGLMGRRRGFISHQLLPSGIGKAGSKAAFHQGKLGFQAEWNHSKHLTC